ncbi:hypothetical protein AVEN_145971-1 [Araneus ventricosus]|uniref:Uncharacterized protein n=1 Tax=Araneus ventricosus TaxID=182803 RepID=A0A4Y2IVX4_ARAVE|nr:hypothetical protein AVEN_145971-1 [Araneus ventricosus]
MVIGGVDVIATEKKRKGKRKQIGDKRKTRKMVKTDAQSMELLQLNTMSSSSSTDTDVITLEYHLPQQENVIDMEFRIEQLLHLPVLFYETLKLCTKERLRM